MAKVGEKLDLEFSVAAVVDGEKRECRFSSLLDGPTLVSVYMRNNTSSCDRQTQQLREVADLLNKRGVGVIGVSKDTVGSHARYASKFELGFPLVSDPHHAFAKATNSLVEKKMYGKTFLGPTRSAYLLDGDGAVLGVIEKVDSANHAEQARLLVDACGL